MGLTIEQLTYANGWTRCSTCGLVADGMTDGNCTDRVRCIAVATGASLGGPIWEHRAPAVPELDENDRMEINAAMNRRRIFADMQEVEFAGPNDMPDSPLAVSKPPVEPDALEAEYIEACAKEDRDG